MKKRLLEMLRRWQRMAGGKESYSGEFRTGVRECIIDFQIMMEKGNTELEALEAIAEAAEKQVAKWKENSRISIGQYDPEPRALTEAVENWQRIKGGEG